MRSGLCVAYWSLLLVSLGSSCILFILVASERTKADPAIAQQDQRIDEGLTEHNVVFNRKENFEGIQFVKEEDGDIEIISKNPSSGSSKDANYPIHSSISSSSNSRRNKGKSADPTTVTNNAATTNSRVGGENNDQTKSNEGLHDIPAAPAVITLHDKTPEIIIENGAFDNLDSDNVDLLEPSSSPSDSDSNLAMLSIKINNSVNSDLPISTQTEPATLTKSTDEFDAKKESILSDETPPDIIINEIDDSGGGTINLDDNNNQDIKSNVAAVEEGSVVGDVPSLDGLLNTTPEKNLTEEENLIPVFSEWAQKQMEEAKKELEKKAVNSSSMRKNATSGSKPQVMKLRAKNYASPDCGAKIIASNSEAQNIGAVLTALKDEYMLSPCTSRIWFVVELCEAIQAEKVDLANFELFSSSPKNFSVAVNNRFPTREWSNVGRFIADDQRNIQSFELFPHLFGKFVRVDIHSHYNSEHFCPISLFRVYGTSEFEAFETENRLPVDEVDDFDDEETLDQGTVKNENTLFKSASDAVMSIVKKAAEVLVKPNPNRTDSTENITNRTELSVVNNNCFTPKTAFACDKCSENLVTKVNSILSCKYEVLTSTLNIDSIRKHIISSRLCAKRYNLYMNNQISGSSDNSISSSNNNMENLGCNHQSPNGDNRISIDERQSYFLSAFSLEYLAAMCHVLATISNASRSAKYTQSDRSDTALNLTIDQKARIKFPIDGGGSLAGAKNIAKDKLPRLTPAPSVKKSGEYLRCSQASCAHTTEGDDKIEEKTNFLPEDINDSIKRDMPLDQGSGCGQEEEETQMQQPPTQKELELLDDVRPVQTPNVNIFNIVDSDEPKLVDEQIPTPPRQEDDLQTSSETVTIKSTESLETREIDVENNSWDNFDNIILTETITSEPLSVASNSGASVEGNVVNPQTPQKVHSESVFIRLSNRVKALERNMSLSGQYLEELSRRYKKQVEELQHSFAKTLSAIEEQNRRITEREQQLIDQNKNFRETINELSNRLSSWITLVICLGTFVFFQIIVAWLMIRSFRIQQLNLLRHFEESSLVKRRSAEIRRKLCRRKSLEGVSGHPTPIHKIRRPSEEAMKISGSYNDLMIDEDTVSGAGFCVTDESKDVVGEMTKKKPNKKTKRSNNSKKNFVGDRRTQDSGSSESSTISTAGISLSNDVQLLDEDYESYMPGSDLAYNEFMPEGPSGDYIKSLNGGNSSVIPSIQKSGKQPKQSGKTRRLSSPAFLKSPFSRSNKKMPHGPTGWEWYKLKKSEHTNTPSNKEANKKDLKKAKSESPESIIKVNGFGNNCTSDSSLSEIMSSMNGNRRDSTAMNELTSEGVMTNSSANTNVSLNNNTSSVGKKQGSFRKIFKKMF